MKDIRAIIIDLLGDDEPEEQEQYDMGEWLGKPNYDALPYDEKVLADNLLDTYEEVGPFDETENIWVTYTPGPENEDAAIGVKCENCAFYKAEDECMILALAIDPEGICRFSVIPPGKVNVDG